MGPFIEKTSSDWRPRIITERTYYDLSAAFDTVAHENLIGKLNIYGFNQEAITWKKSYLNNRKQMVHIQGHVSTPHYLHPIRS